MSKKSAVKVLETLINKRLPEDKEYKMINEIIDYSIMLIQNINLDNVTRSTSLIDMKVKNIDIEKFLEFIWENAEIYKEDPTEE